jgi:TlyA family rRNA methyltransferase/putative hemolysin
VRAVVAVAATLLHDHPFGRIQAPPARDHAARISTAQGGASFFLSVTDRKCSAKQRNRGNGCNVETAILNCYAAFGPSTVILGRDHTREVGGSSPSSPIFSPFAPHVKSFASRAGQKLEHAIANFAIDVTGKVCADLGSNVGGFVDCLLQRGATKVYSIDTGYGVLDWKLRNDPRVVVMERTNAMHAQLPEPVAIVTIDVAWTRQKIILPAAKRMLRESGDLVTLIKPHYEADRKLLREGVLPGEHVDAVVDLVRADITAAGFEIVGTTSSPVTGAGGNMEMLAWLRPAKIV